MYSTLLTIHDGLRWLILLSGFAAVIAAVAGLSGKRPFRPLGRVAGLVFTSVMDLQVLIGIALMFLSPWVVRFWSSPVAGMKERDARFFGMEHAVIMLIAVALCHIGAVRSKRATDDAKAYRTALIWFLPSLALILAGIPWWRPMLRI